MDNNIKSWHNSANSSYSNFDYLVDGRNIRNLLSDKKTFLVRNSKNSSISIYFSIENYMNTKTNIKNKINMNNSCIESYLRPQICIDSSILEKVSGESKSTSIRTSIWIIRASSFESSNDWYDPEDPYDPDPEDPYDPDPEDPYDPDPEDPEDPEDPYDPYDPDPEDPYDPDPEDPYDPDPEDPYDPYDPDDSYDPEDPEDPEDDSYDPEDPEDDPEDDSDDEDDWYDSDDELDELLETPNSLESANELLETPNSLESANELEETPNSLESANELEDEDDWYDWYDSDDELDELLETPNSLESANDLEETPKYKYKHLWVECENCYGLNYKKFFKSKMNICEHCGCHLKMSSSDRIELLIDPDTWNPMDEYMVSVDPIEFHSEEEPYKNRLDSYQKRTGLKEAVQTGTGQLNGIPLAIGIMDFQFMGGSMGSVVGEKITRLIEYATNQRLPLILVCASGGARMQEGSLSLMQMAKISSALYNYQLNQKLFYVPILTSPTTGGVTASFGMLGDIIIAEPDAYIAFAGKRVIEQTLNKEVPEGSQSAEFLFQKGLFDLIVPRNLLKEVLTELFQFHGFVPLTQNEK